MLFMLLMAAALEAAQTEGASAPQKRFEGPHNESPRALPGTHLIAGRDSVAMQNRPAYGWSPPSEFPRTHTANVAGLKSGYYQSN